MKKNNQKIIWIIGRIVFTIIIVCISSKTAVFENLGKAITPFLIGSIFAFILNMLLNIIEKKVFRLKSYNKKARGFSILLSIIIFITLGFTKGLMFAYYHTLARIFSILLGGLLALIHCKYGNSVTKIFYRQHSLLCSLYLIILIVMSLFNTENTIINLILLIISTTTITSPS